MHFSFSIVNENADENEIPFSAEKNESHLCGSAFITELSYGSVANITLYNIFVPTQMTFLK